VSRPDAPDSGPLPGDPEEHPDAAALRRIGTALDRTLFVEAGAGSGKTRALVDRVLALVGGGIPIEAIAAITFTEKAAAELRDRIRGALDQRVAAPGGPEAVGTYRTALDDLDRAAIGTLHSFARRILSEHPVEAGLPPHIEVLDEVASIVAFDDRWSTFLDDLLDDPALARPLLLLTAAGVRLPALRDIALSFNQNWDLVAERAPAHPEAVPEWEPQLEGILAEVDAVCAEREHCREEHDPLNALLYQLAEWARWVREAPDESARLALIRQEGGRPKASPNGKGAKTRWTPGHDLNGLRARVQAIQERCESLANQVAHDALVRVAVGLRRFTLEAAEERRREGRLEFHDLLVMARQLLRDPTSGPSVRAVLAERYQRLLVDEFQDTDPIQVELAALVASTDPGASLRPWAEADPKPGRLFFVGDPKQSIYRFRRADIALFLEVAGRFGDAANQGERLSLRTNHRSGHQLLAWINRIFGRLIVTAPEPEGAAGNDERLPSQPRFEPLVAVRPDPPVGPPVAVMGRRAHTDRPKADELRAREATDVATAVSTILAEGWQVDGSEDWRQPDWRPTRAGDIAILVPTRQPLPFLEEALTRAGIAYRTESASLVYTSRPIRDLFVSLRAIDDPSDELLVVAALRTPLFGCGDDDLFTFRELHRGTFDHSRKQPEATPEDHPVARGLAYMRAMHQQRRWTTPSELLDRVVADRRLLEMGDAQGRPRDLWQRVRFVVDQARAWTDTTHGNLRQYLDWIRHQTAPGSRVAEAVLPETDDDAVRIMTVHAAKGLQFPVTIVAGLSTQPQRGGRGAQVVWPADGPCIFKVGRKVTSPAFEAWQPLDQQMSHDERTRLLYVACTRARDHLVVSLHRSERALPLTSAARATNAELLVDALGEEVDLLPQVVATGHEVRAEPRAPSPESPASPSLPSFDAWAQERSQALDQSGRHRTVAATALTDEGTPDAEADPGLQKRPGDLDRPPWRKGRYGTAIGRAVHGVLQVVDLASGAGVDGAVAAQAAAEGVVGHEHHIRALVSAALRSPSVVEAAASPHWREVHVAVPLGRERILEGYVDLLYRRSDGLVVVDYKTGPDTPDGDLDPLLERYQLQGAAYALAVIRAADEPVVQATFVFLTPSGPAERSIADLPAAVAKAERLLQAGTFTTTDSSIERSPHLRG
jgi:ATP-dependent helicase/nuclease subunit A